ncbi:BatA domain-containing protein [Neorhodopirellula pilleata]|uniref:Aerotolerance regulator N-terminal domain-containing protein n=1 Tax=Neorhodopirellula pilleata TaxID=2714738 RepID=A0A5C6A0Q7_9BACT|nr:BatA domain-containing protein [Neorhodopirellula pilleata]TWT93159.1 hypothetical protein Pla100_44760 [Neorhodopirellula pilleata]
MLLYPALAAGFLFIGVPLLVHLINLLRHRRTQWAAMDFLLASYRKQRRWIVLRQLLLLLTRLAVAALLIALLAGLIGGKKLIGAIGGQTTHHVVVLDDSYSMRQRVASGIVDSGAINGNDARDRTAYDRGLSALSTLVRRLAADDGVHQLTVMRASRASMIAGSGDGTADAAADIVGQTVTNDARQIERLMSTRASSLRIDLVPAIDLASDLLAAAPADVSHLYVVSDFTRRDWQSPRRLAQSLEDAEKAGAEISMIDCGSAGGDETPRNLAITDVSPEPDVWVAGVPVKVNVTVKNYSSAEVKNVAMSANVITYGEGVRVADPTSTVSGKVQSLPAIIIESIPAGQQLTKSFQVYIDQEGTHVVRVGLPDDVLPIDNIRSCTIPLADAQRVLIIDNDPDGSGAYHVSSVLDPGSQVRIGAIPEVRPASMLRDATLETLKRYRAIYVIDVPEVSERVAETLERYVRDGGGLAWFLGDDVNAESYNRVLASDQHQLLPFELGTPRTTEQSLGGTTDDDDSSGRTADAVVFGKDSDLLGPIASAGNGVFGLVNVRQAWTSQSPDSSANSVLNASTSEPESVENNPSDSELDVRVLLQRGEDPLAVRHVLGRGRVVTVMTGLDGQWNNWPGDPTFVVFLLQSNAMLFSGAAPPTSRFVDVPAELPLSGDAYLPNVVLLPPADEPPRLAIELEADANANASGSIQLEQSTAMFTVSPIEMAITDQAGFDEFLMPGIVEWQRTRTDGQTIVTPMASVLRVGESDLVPAAHAEIIRDLLPIQVEFIAPDAWENTDAVGGLSTFLLFLLGLLLILLAIEQALAAWASYHVQPSASSRSSQHGATRGGNQSFATQRNRTRNRGGRRGDTTRPADSGADNGTPVEASR